MQKEVALELGRSLKSFKSHDRKSLETYEQTVARNMDIKGDSCKVLDGNEDRVIGIWKKGDPCYKMANNLA